MPESRPRKKEAFTPPRVSRKPMRIGNSRWLAPTMVALWLVGLAWIVVYYIVPDIPYLRELGNWNLGVGLVLILIGFFLSTKWQ